jgi:hypothetical protein
LIGRAIDNLEDPHSRLDIFVEPDCDLFGWAAIQTTAKNTKNRFISLLI